MSQPPIESINKPIGWINKDKLPPIQEQGRTDQIIIWKEPYMPEHVPLYTKPLEVTEEMIQAAELVVYRMHERGFLKPLIDDPIDMRKALEAALSVA